MQRRVPRGSGFGDGAARDIEQRHIGADLDEHAAPLVNQRAHERALKRAGMARGPSKLPRLFGIGLHVDDSQGVAEEGVEYGFDVVVIRPDDPEWAGKVLAAARDRHPP